MLIPRPSVPLRHLVQPSSLTPLHPHLGPASNWAASGGRGLSFSPHFALTPAPIEVRSRVVQGLSMPGHPESDQCGGYSSPHPTPLRTFHSLTSLKGKGGRGLSPEPSARQVRVARPHCPLDPTPTRLSAPAGVGARGSQAGARPALFKASRETTCRSALALRTRRSEDPAASPARPRTRSSASTGPPPRARPALRTGPPRPRHEPGACRRGGRSGAGSLRSLRSRSGDRGTRAGGVKKDADPNAGRGRGAGGGRRKAGDGMADAPVVLTPSCPRWFRNSSGYTL